MVSKKKCSSYGQELASKPTTRSAVGLNACRWEQHEEDTPAYDVIEVPDLEPTLVGARKVKRTAHPKAKPRSKPRNTDLEFVQAPKKVRAKSKPKAKGNDKDKGIPSNLRSGLTSKHAKQLRAYNGSKRTKQRIEIYLKRGLSFSEAKKRAISRDKNETGRTSRDWRHDAKRRQKSGLSSEPATWREFSSQRSSGPGGCSPTSGSGSAMPRQAVEGSPKKIREIM